MPSEESLMRKQAVGRKAIELRLKGRDYHRIGALLGCTTGEARGYVKEAIAALEESEIQAVVEITIIELARLDYMIAKLLKRIEFDDQDNRAYDLVLKIQARRAAYIGLDQQKERIEVSAGALPNVDLQSRARAILAKKVGTT